MCVDEEDNQMAYSNLSRQSCDYGIKWLMPVPLIIGIIQLVGVYRITMNTVQLKC